MEISRVDAAIDHAVSEIAKTDMAIAQVREEYMALTVTGPQDQDGYRSAEVALKKVVRMRTSVEKKRKELKADSVRYGKAVDGEARRIRELIEPIEEHLKKQCDIVRLEEARQQVAAENARRDEVNGWVRELSELGCPFDLPALQRMTPEEFGFVRLSAKKRFAEQQAEQQELEELRAEKAKREAATKIVPDEVSGWVAELSELGYAVDLPALEVKKRFAEQQAERQELEELRAEKAKREAATEFVPAETDDTKEQLLLTCDALGRIPLLAGLGEYREVVREIILDAIGKIRGLA